MSNFVLFTDSACDINADLLASWGVRCIKMSYRFDGDDKNYEDGEMDITQFYNRMREGGVAKTAAINPISFTEAFEPVLKDGKDILYLCFSSALSTTFNSSKIASEELLESYPDRKILCADTLCASAGQGLLVYLAAQKQKDGASLSEISDFVESIKPNLCHWFSVDDLVYLKRGGRVSSAVAFVGGLLGIKPVLHVDDNGALINVSKVRGRKAALKALADIYEDLADKSGNYPVFISHGDCIDDVTQLENMLFERFGVKFDVITDIGAVIGAHAGPGTIALFFIGKNR